MRIGIDAMGGDYAPRNVVLGAIEAYGELKNGSQLVLFGNKDELVSICREANFDESKFDIVATSEVIQMTDHPAKSFSQKPNSSIAVGFKHLHEGDIDGFASAGNTGAMLAGTMYTVKAIPGIIRPCISGTFPMLTGTDALLLDVGLNPDCKPDVLYQYAILGSIYAHNVMGYENPRVGLLNIGEEEEKGDILTKATYELMKGTKDFNFVGNIEGHELFSGKKADVIVCDGFVGNVLLKHLEGLYRLSTKLNTEHEFFNRFNYELLGGTPILGVNSTVMIGHGASTPLAIKSMILQTEHVINVDLVNKFKAVL